MAAARLRRSPRGIREGEEEGPRRGAVVPRKGAAAKEGYTTNRRRRLSLGEMKERED